MVWSRLLISVALVALTSVGAQGFQETVPEAPSEAPAVSGDAGSTSSDSPLGLAPDDEAEADRGPSAQSTVLPNLDFGLELLYGSKPAASSVGTPDEGDVGLSGRLKHSF